MKAHLAKLSLALLSTVFLLGCQDMGSEPVGLDGLVPQFDRKGEPDTLCDTNEPEGPRRDEKGHCHGDEVVVEDATFEATFTVDVTGVATPLFGPHSGKQNIGGGGVHQPTITLNLTDFLQTPNDGYTNGEGINCFPADVEYPGILDIRQKTPGSKKAVIQYNFTAKDKVNGNTDIRYALGLSGFLDDPAKWAPAIGVPATITGGTFQVAPSHGPGDISCKGTGNANFSIVVERIT